MKIVVGIIIFKSNLDVLFKSLKMLSKQTFGHESENNLEVFILDNNEGSQIDEVKQFLSSSEINLNITTIKSENVGFGAGHNKIFSYAQRNGIFDYYLCMNPDGIPEFSMIEKLSIFAKTAPKAGLIEAIQFPVEHPKIYDSKTKETKWCSGSCLLVPFIVYKELNGFDESFFMYMEDVDLSWRVRAAGYKCYINNDAIFSHSIDNKERSNLKQDLMMRVSALRLAKKYNNKKWIKKIQTRLSKQVNPLEFQDILIKLDELKPEKNLLNFKGIIDFSHGFQFSEARW